MKRKRKQQPVHRKIASPVNIPCTDDPTQEKQFKQVVNHFLTTKPEPHGKREPASASPRRRSTHQSRYNRGDTEKA